MKRLFTREKWKRHLAARARSQEKAQARFAEYRRQRNTGSYAQPRTRHKSFRKTTSLKAPEIFSLVRNPSETIWFFNRIKALTNARNVFVDLAEVSDITPDAIAGLLATIHHGESRNANISGNFPQDARLREILNNSGFRDYVKTPSGYQYQRRLGNIQEHARSRETVEHKFNQFLANELIEFAIRMLTGTAGPHRPSFSIFGEAMLNTLNHASRTGNPERWWASVFFDPQRLRACFTFIDLGVGIFRSHRLTMKLKLFKHLSILNNSQILEQLFHGTIPSSTRVPGRGNGIPGMYKHCKAKRIRNFTVIANDAIGNAETESYHGLSSSFDGTILYWEIEHDRPEN